MNKLNAMHTFVQIVQAGSLTAAADVLNTSLPTVVRTLAALESHLDIRLMNRTTRKVSLTEEGMVYLEHCRNILYEIEQAELALSALQREPSGKLRVTASVMFGTMRLTPLINRFLQQYNKVRIDMMLSDSYVNLIEEGIDVGIRIGPLNDSTMVAKKVGSVRRIICGTPQLLNRIGPVESPQALSQIPCIHFSGLSPDGYWQLFDAGEPVKIEVNGPLSCNQMPAAMAAVKDGMGLGMFLSYMVEKELRSGELQTVLEPFEPQPIPVHVVFSSTKLMSTRVRAFVDWLTLELRRQFEG